MRRAVQEGRDLLLRVDHVVDPVFTAPRQHSAPEVIFAAWGYAVQIYCDFSGYTDIAIGLAMLLGFRFPQNSTRPTRARNLQDFWRRWHMTLSRWLRDYLYIPLGGNRGSECTDRRCNIMITMVLGGLWHGAAWTFVVWGALPRDRPGRSGTRAAGRVRRAGLPRSTRSDGVAVAWARFVTFQFVCLGWLFFRADTLGDASRPCWAVCSTAGEPSPLVTPLLCSPSSPASASQYLPDDWLDRVQTVLRRPPPGRPGRHARPGPARHHHPRAPGVAPFIYYRF